MALLSLQEVSISFGGSTVLDKVSMQVEKGERVCLLGRIELLEQEQKELYKQLGDPGFCKGGGERIAPARIRVDNLQQELDEAYVRWEEVESIHHEDAKI